MGRRKDSRAAISRACAGGVAALLVLGALAGVPGCREKKRNANRDFERQQDELMRRMDKIAAEQDAKEAAEKKKAEEAKTDAAKEPPAEEKPPEKKPPG